MEISDLAAGDRFETVREGRPVMLLVKSIELARFGGGEVRVSDIMVTFEHMEAVKGQLEIKELKVSLPDAVKQLESGYWKRRTFLGDQTE